MNKKTLKLIFTFIFILIYLSMFSFIFKVYADVTVIDIIEDPASTPPEEKIKNMANPILTVIQIITLGIALGFIINDGIKLVTTTDLNEKANLKRKIAYYIIGGVFIFTPVTIIKFLTNITDGLL